MLRYSIFIVDDEQTIREGITTVLSGDYDVFAFGDAESLFKKLTVTIPDLILLDIGLPGMDGIEALRRIKEIDPMIPVIMITAYEDISSVIAAMKTGAYDYIIKPVHMESLELSIEKALETVKLRKEIRQLQDESLQDNLPFFIGKSNAIQNVMDFIKLVARSPDTPILISGETGTGKELIARAVHYRSPNFKGPLVSMNCASIPGELIESELFGYTKGAFTGASQSGKKGLIEAAENGTLFLDEIGDLSLRAQAKLLRFLEEGEFYRIGSTEKHTVSTRVISATNKDLEKMAADGSFRKDLYFRLGVVTVKVPSLNERREDIEPLAKSFLCRYAAKFEKPAVRISEEALRALKNHQWQGNIRELKNLIERAVLICEGKEITLGDLGLEPKSQPAARTQAGDTPVLPELSPQGLNLDELENAVASYYFDAALRLSGGNESAAARLLGLNHHTFRYRNKKLSP